MGSQLADFFEFQLFMIIEQGIETDEVSIRSMIRVTQEIVTFDESGHFH